MLNWKRANAQLKECACATGSVNMLYWNVRMLKCKCANAKLACTCTPESEHMLNWKHAYAQLRWNVHMLKCGCAYAQLACKSGFGGFEAERRETHIFFRLS